MPKQEGMKLSKLILIKVILLVIATSLSFKSFAQKEICQHGLEYKFSHSNTWGEGYPIITFIAPNSPAEEAGLKLHDIIRKVDDFDCQELGEAKLNSLLQSSASPHVLEVSNFAYKDKLCLLKLECKYEENLDEAELAQLFSSYSPRDIRNIGLLYPFYFEANKQFNLEQYQTYACAKAEGQTKTIDSLLNDEIEKILNKKGLKKVQLEQAELIISPYYELKAVNNLKNGEGRFSWRYDSKHKTLVPQPILLTQDLANWELLFGLTIQEQASKQIIWSAEAKEYLYNLMTIEQYASANLGLLLANFPFIEQKQDLNYEVSILRYNYTGLSFSATDLNLITDVKIGSPAFEAGLRIGDKILAINKRTFASPFIEKSLEDYLNNMTKLKKYQNQYNDITGLSLNFYRKEDFAQINEHIRRPHWHTALSYLFAFRPQIAENSSQIIIFEVERNGQQYTVPIKAIRRDETSIRLCK